MNLHTFSTLALLGASAFVLVACGGDKPAPVTEAETAQEYAPVVAEVDETSLEAIIAHPRRAEDQARDKFRNPKETLEFFEVGPGKSVAEIWPGWYTDIIAPYMAANGGTYRAVLYPMGLSERLDARIEAYKTTYSDTSVYGEVQYGSFLKDVDQIAPENSLDVVLTFRNVHNWMGGGYEDQAFKAFYSALKPGGVLGVVEHRLPESATQDPKANSGYVQESYLKSLAKDAGFEFVSSSEVNANPRDTADHPYGVWTLPPSSRGPADDNVDKDTFKPEQYVNIGESDRATLKFRKPL